MINIHAFVDKQGVLQELEADGHALFAGKGNDIVCSAVSILIQTAVKIFEAKNLLIGDKSALAERGFYRFQLNEMKKNEAEWLGGVSAFLLQGLDNLQSQYPGNVSLYIEVRKE